MIGIPAVFDKIIIMAEYYKVKADGTRDTVLSNDFLDQTTYDLVDKGDGSGVLTFTTATEAYAAARPTEKFAFSAPAFLNIDPLLGYKLTVTSTDGQTGTISNVRLGYRRHIDINGSTLKEANDTYFNDALVISLGKHQICLQLKQQSILQMVIFQSVRSYILMLQEQLEKLNQ